MGIPRSHTITVTSTLLPTLEVVKTINRSSKNPCSSPSKLGGLTALLAAALASTSLASAQDQFTSVFKEDFNSADGALPTSLDFHAISGVSEIVDGAFRSNLTPNGVTGLDSAGISASTIIDTLGGDPELAADFQFTGDLTVAENIVDSTGNRSHIVGFALLAEGFDNWTPLESNVVAIRFGGTGAADIPGQILAGSGLEVGIGGDVDLGTFTGDITAGSTISYTISASYTGGPGLDVVFTLSDGIVEESFEYRFPTAAIGSSFGVYTLQNTTHGSFDVDFDNICISAEATTLDSDDDGVSDTDELLKGTDPQNPDTDADGLSDGSECSIETDPLNPDTDDDGVIDGDEVDQGSNPLNPDTDGDGLGDAVDPFPTEPAVPDDFVEQGLCNLAYTVRDLPINEFAGTRSGYGPWHWWAKYIHRHRLACQIFWACQSVKCGHFDLAARKIDHALLRLDGEPWPCDWMNEGEAKEAVEAELTMLRELLELL